MLACKDYNYATYDANVHDFDKDVQVHHQQQEWEIQNIMFRHSWLDKLLPGACGYA